MEGRVPPLLSDIPARHFGSRLALQSPINPADSEAICVLIQIKQVHSSDSYQQKATYKNIIGVVMNRLVGMGL